MFLNLLTLMILKIIVSYEIAVAKKAYEIELQTYEPFSNTGKEYFDPGTLRIVRKGRNTFAITGDFAFYQNLGDELILSYEVLNKGIDHSYKPLAKGANNYCKFTQENVGYEKLAAVSNLPFPPLCPFPKGNYTIDNFQVDEEFLPLVLPGGDYMAKISYVMGDDVLFGYNVKAHVK